MSKFKKGDLCVVIASGCNPSGDPLVGKECEVIGPAKHPLARVVNEFGLNPGHYLLDIVMSDGARHVVCERSLRLRKPPKKAEKKGSWVLLEALLGWRRPQPVMEGA